MKRITAVFLLFSVIIVLLFTQYEEDPKQHGFTAYRLIAHATGSIEDQYYTNTYDAMVENYGKGTRVFEIDFMLSADRKVVARHEWTKSMTEQLGQQYKLPEDKQAARLTHDEFINTPIQDKYQPLDVGRVLDLMQRYPDIYIVTDTKEEKDEDIHHLFTELVTAAKQRDPELLDRVVVQIYNEPMLDIVENVYPFKSLIYTLYATQDSNDRVARFVKEHEIDAVTMPEYRVSPNFIAKLKRMGVVTYVHTINDMSTVNNYEKLGVYGVYSDDITEPELVANSLRYNLKP
ncbi:phosphatidylinositol-specific phospholipase C/glycerophosphodiester phosphodiesterase family protein [Paenibacillus sp. GCM10028914]|uniref:phosphatidylinositol-specific phospholipase C/glycerophosphodiester phosphodiesterase family protein n=1 Tax=Paenibacillus sp. GCM10028914 TaxID=3273416 RepID=UPI0036088371